MECASMFLVLLVFFQGTTAYWSPRREALDIQLASQLTIPSGVWQQYINPFPLPVDGVVDCMDPLQTLAAINDFRNAYGLQPLEWDPDLSGNAKEDLATSTWFTCPGGTAYQDPLLEEKQAAQMAAMEAQMAAMNASMGSNGSMPGASVAPSPLSVGTHNATFTSGNRSQSLKCVQAANYWFYQAELLRNDTQLTYDLWSQIVALNPNQQAQQSLSDVAKRAAMTQQVAALLWSTSTSVGCAMKFCGTPDTALTLPYFVQCTFDDGGEAFDAAKFTLPARKEGVCLNAVLTQDTVNPARIVTLYGIADEVLVCYNEQLNWRDASQANVPLAIPCPGSSVPPACADWAFIAGFSKLDGTCPMTYQVLPGETLSSIAGNLTNGLKNVNTATGLNLSLTADELCCYNPSYNSSQSGGCDNLPYMQGLISTIIIPCPEDVALKPCNGTWTRPDIFVNATLPVLQCPDSNETVELINEFFRTPNGLIPLQWDDEYAQALESQFQEMGVGIEACAGQPAANAFKGTEYAGNLFWGLTRTGPLTSLTCAGALVSWAATAKELSATMQLFKLPTSVAVNLDPASLNVAMAGMTANASTRVGCVLQVCDTFYVQQTCVFDLTKEDITPELEKGIDIQQPDVPPLLYALGTSDYSIDVIANRFDLAPQQIVCYKQQFENVGTIGVWWSFVEGIAIPAADEISVNVTCPGWELYQGFKHPGSVGDFLYYTMPGDTCASIAYSFILDAKAQPNFTGEAICCFNNLTVRDIHVIFEPRTAIIIPTQATIIASHCTAEELYAAIAAENAAASGSGGGLSGGAIAGIVVGSVVGVALVGLAAFILGKHFSKEKVVYVRADLVPLNKGTEYNGPPLTSIYTESIAAFSVADSMEQSASDHTTWVVDMQSIRIAERGDGELYVLGKGGFSTVYRGQYNDEEVAVKVMQHSAQSEQHIRVMLKEINMLRRCKHEYIVEFKGAAFGNNAEVLMVFEFMEGGTLMDALGRPNADDYKWAKLGKHILLQIAEGLAFLHSRKVMHCDLKSPNVLLSGGYPLVAKIGDMGMSKYMNTEYVSKGGDLGSFPWSAPELLMDSKVSIRSDIYSFGVMMWEVATGEKPVRGQMRAPEVPAEIPQEVADMISRCRNTDPYKRPTADEIVDFLKKYNDE